MKKVIAPTAEAFQLASSAQSKNVRAYLLAWVNPNALAVPFGETPPATTYSLHATNEKLEAFVHGANEPTAEGLVPYSSIKGAYSVFQIQLAADSVFARELEQKQDSFLLVHPSHPQIGSIVFGSITAIRPIEGYDLRRRRSNTVQPSAEAA